jgi:glycosyltransferase involved in cell wall biosynthesis
LTLTNSEAARQAVLDAEGLSPGRVRVIENAVDVERFGTNRPPDTAGSVVRVGAAANLRPVKNIDGLIRVAANICQNDHRVQFEVAGEGQQRPELEGRIHQAELSDRFTLRGGVADIPAFLAGIDIAVLPSHSESMSNALLEYMAAGRAIIATDVGANARLVRHEREGLIVPPADDTALEAAIRRLLAGPALARRLAAAARRRTEAEFGRGTMVRRFEDFFESLSFRGPAV